MDWFGNRCGNRMLATAPLLPFKITPFVNKRTDTRSWRVTGSGKDGRVRKNFPLEAQARAECDRLNADEIRKVAELPPLRALPTRLTEAELMSVEVAKEKAKGRWDVAEIVDAGLQSLESAPVRELVRPLFEVWQAGPALELNELWRTQVIQSVERFLVAHPRLHTNEWKLSVTRTWLDSLGVGGQTKAGIRNALHRFARWLVEKEKLRDNPAGGLWITRAKEREGLPVVYTVVQAKVRLEVCQSDPGCRPILGWLVLTMLCGLRPESEAPELRATQIKLREREIILKGNKRGSKPRIVPIQPAAYEFLRIILKEAAGMPGYFTRGLCRRLDRLTDEALRAKGQPLLPAGVDLERHTYASMRAATGVSLPDLSKEMGNDIDTLYGHYLQPLPKREALKFWEARPAA